MYCPCKDCKERKLYCHDTCGKYKEYQDERKKMKERERQMNDEPRNSIGKVCRYKNVYRMDN